MLKNLVNFFFLIFISWNNIDNTTWDEAQKYYNQKDYNKSVVLLQSIVQNEQSNKIIDSKYLLAEIFLNVYEEYDIAISFYDDIINNYSYHELAKKSLFTLAYVYGNYLDSYNDAFDKYSMFLNKYPQDELIPSVKYEIEILNDRIEEANKLIIN